jgi:hypothetical protein
MIQQSSTEMFNLLLIPILVIALGSVVLFVAALVTFLNTENMGDDRVVWAIVIVLTGPIGSILWFIIGRPKFQKLSRLP